MKWFTLGVFTTILGLLVGGVSYLLLGFAEVRADANPPGWEARLTKAAIHASVRRRAEEVSNPIAPTEDNLLAGGKLYLDQCAGCHGKPGKPDQFDTAHSLYPPVPQLAETGTEYTEAQIFWIAKHGIRRTGMFANGKWNSDEKLWTIAAYIRRIKSLPPKVQQGLREAEKNSP